MAKKPLSFRDFMVVDYTPGRPDLISYQAHKRRRGRHDSSGPIGEEVSVDEALSAAARRKLGRNMKMKKSLIKRGRERALKRTPDIKTLKKRAERTARNEILKALTKGKGREELTYARRQELEKRLDKMKSRIQRIAKKKIPELRKLDRERKQGKRK